ncbi:MAG TPA: IS66 family insertion sequence element accessory protein TnpB [Gammaproteobacteria bacterium]|nr:IS66 family insertion sequence element accessory protein TnpB [Gammaproteobacteria bacterium]
MSRASRAEWAKRVERWKDSGLSAKQYAAETGLKASTLSYWSWKLRASGEPDRERAETEAVAAGRLGRSKPVAGAAARFVELTTSTSAPASTPALELVLSGGVRVRVTAGFDEATLTRVVRAVEASR